jgi:hypothetical protein
MITSWLAGFNITFLYILLFLLKANWQRTPKQKLWPGGNVGGGGESALKLDF